MATTLYTIGFTRSTAERFFERLREAGIRRLVDIRLHNTSTLAGFTKRDDLPYFLRAILDAQYVHEPLLVPTPEMLTAYRSHQGKRAREAAWDAYAAQYSALLDERSAATTLDRATFEGPAVLLCSEAAPEHCHRRLAAEYVARHWGGLEVVHL